MKKALIFGMFLFLGICGCAETPEKEFVISKVNGLPESAVVEKSKEVKEISVPENWEETISKNDGAVTVEANGISISVPEIKNTPITEVKRTAFGEEQLKKLTDYFRGDNPLQEPSLLTKDEGGAYMEKIKNREGAYGNSSLEEGMNATDRLSNMKKVLETLPAEDMQTAEIKEPTFGPYKEDTYEAMLSGGNEEYMQETFGDSFFSGEISGKDDKKARISAVKYDAEKGLNGGFFYIEGGVVTEDQVQKAAGLQETAPEKWKSEFADFFVKFEKETEELPLTEEKAEEEVRKLLEDLEIKNMQIRTVEKVFWSPTDTRWDFMDPDWENGQAGYKIYMGMDNEGLVSYSQSGGTFYQDLSEAVYKPSFAPEEIQVVVTENGVKSFLWKNMSEKGQVIAENTNLLPFEEITEKLGSHMLAVKVAVDGINGFDGKETSNEWKVKSVQLQSSYVPAYEEPQNAWLVPVWVFELEGCTINHLDGDRKGQVKNETVVLNAIDGGYVSPVQEMDFFN
ncbi:MAG: DUF6034 family protein [Eubacteriales bacterium]|nr:DUF6034 family protein [Eubacteriales bacterium]